MQREISERVGFAGIYRYWTRFKAHAVARARQDHQNCVLDFGAGHSVYEDGTLFAQVQALLAPQPNVFLILPWPDLDESVAVLKERNTPKNCGRSGHMLFGHASGISGISDSTHL